tara:strand:+ start:45 stop:368 length:324 start_codon:yes stop_codon:yes gene_type:complete
MDISRINDPYYFINQLTMVNDEGCILLPEHHIRRLRKKRPIFVHNQKGQYLNVIEIHCGYQDETNLPIFEPNDFLLVSEAQLNRIDNLESFAIFTNKKERIVILKKT